MSINPRRSAVFGLALLMALLCIAATLYGSVMASGSSPLAASAENLTGGNSQCSDFMNGVAVGMGVGALFGCVWCIAGGVVAKGVALFC